MELNHVWRLHIRPRHVRSDAAERWCFARDGGGRAGIGWGLPEEPSTVAEAFQMAELYYTRELHNDDWRQPYDSFLNQCRAGDLLWARSSAGPYYLGRINGSWRYDGSDSARRAGLHHWRPCAWQEVGALVPGAVSRLFSTAQTLAPVESEAARYFSARSWNERSPGEAYALPRSAGVGYFDFLDPKALDALVASYLQLAQDYYLMPKAQGLHAASPGPGMFIRRADGARAVACSTLSCQPLRMNTFRLLPKDVTAFVFAPNAAQACAAPGNVAFIEKQELLDFVDQYKGVLPQGLSYWKDYVIM